MKSRDRDNYLTWESGFVDEVITMLLKEMGKRVASIPQRLDIDDKDTFFDKIGNTLGVSGETINTYTIRGFPKKYVSPKGYRVLVYAIERAAKGYGDNLPDEEAFLELWRKEKKGIFEQLKSLYESCRSGLDSLDRIYAHRKFKNEIIVADFLSGHYPECLGKEELNVDDINTIRMAFWKVFPDWTSILEKEDDEKDILPPLLDGCCLDLDFS